MAIILSFAPISFGHAQGEDEAKEVAPSITCMTDVYFSWVRRVPPVSNDAKPKGGAGSAQAIPAEEAKELKKLLFSHLEVAAETEARARERLQALLQKEAVRARDECLRLHENLSGCIAGKFASHSEALKQLDFQARRELQSSITEDCSRQQGECEKATWGEILCGGADAAAKEGETAK